MLELYEYFRSGASFRVRIALNLKGLTYDHIGVHLRRQGGEHHAPRYRRVNPQELVPVLVDEQNTFIQSMAIIEYLDETRPDPPLLPSKAGERARVRGLAQVVACDMHPMNNLRVLQYLRNSIGVDEAGIKLWIHMWQEKGFSALEELLDRDSQTGTFCHGDTPSLADICLVPQVIHAQRFDFDTSNYPTVTGIFDRCLELKAIRDALPGNQPYADPNPC